VKESRKNGQNLRAKVPRRHCGGKSTIAPWLDKRKKKREGKDCFPFQPHRQGRRRKRKNRLEKNGITEQYEKRKHPRLPGASDAAKVVTRRRKKEWLPSLLALEGSSSQKERETVSDWRKRGSACSLPLPENKRQFFQGKRGGGKKFFPTIGEGMGRGEKALEHPSPASKGKGTLGKSNLSSRGLYKASPRR